MTFLSSRRMMLIGLPALVLVAGTAGAGWMMRVPSDLDLAREKSTEAGRYVVAIAPVEEPVTIGEMHAWTVTLADREGASVDDARIAVGGGMPQHGHGLPTQPRVTQALGQGVYVVEGLKFNMGGWWELTFRIDGAAGRDSITFNLDL